MTLACKDSNLKLVEVVTVADADAEKRVDNILAQIWKLQFGHEVKFFLAFRFGRDFENEVPARF